MSNLRRVLPGAVVPAVSALLLAVTATAAQAASRPPSVARGAVIQVAGASSPAAPAAGRAYRVPTPEAAQVLAGKLAARQNVRVELPTGTLRLPQPLRFTAANSGRNGHTITWEAAPGARPVLSGARPVTDWQLYDSSSNIWVANVGRGTNTRQLYVNGKEAPRAAVQVPRSDFTFTTTGLTITNSALDYLAGLPDQDQIEVESLNSFTDHYAPVESISGDAITMQQPSWDNNTWGYDTIKTPFVGGTMYLENSLVSCV